MKIYSTLNIGDFHTNYCEDFLIVENISTNRFIVAVMDGCTMGKESAFASMIIGKILRNIAKEEFYKDFLNDNIKELNVCLQEILKKLFLQLKTTKNNLGLETEEMLSTLIIGVIDQHASNGEFLSVGDGLIHYDGISVEYEQNDKPDYLGYHLGEDFDTWYQSQEQRLSITDFRDLSISTDGIYSFKNFKNPNQQKNEQEIIAFLFRDQQGKNYDNFLEKKIRDLELEYNHVLTDDIAIIRIITEN